MPVAKIYELSRIDPWFLFHMDQILSFEKKLRQMAKEGEGPEQWDREFLKEVKAYGFSDVQLAGIFQTSEESIRQTRKAKGVEPVYKLVDTCAAEFEAFTPYYYSTYEQENEIRTSDKRKVIILGGGPNRIGQGIEFDYCWCTPPWP